MFGEMGGDPFSGLPVIASAFLVQKNTRCRIFSLGLSEYYSHSTTYCKCSQLQDSAQKGQNRPKVLSAGKADIPNHQAIVWFQARNYSLCRNNYR